MDNKEMAQNKAIRDYKMIYQVMEPLIFIFVSPTCQYNL